MIDNEHDSINYTKLMGYILIVTGCTLIWYSIFTHGFFQTLMWLIVGAATMGIWLRVSGRA